MTAQLVGPGTAAPFVGTGGAASSLSAAQVAVITNSMITTNVTSSRAVTAADNGADFTNTGAAGNIVLTVPAGLAIGTTFEISQTALFNIGFTFSGSEVAKIGSAAPQTTITALSNGGTTTGATLRVKKEDTLTYFLKFSVGSVG